jgi:hypothetical protein
MRVLFPDHDHSGLLSRDNDGRRWRRLLDHDLLRFLALANNDGWRRGTRAGIVLGLFAIAIDVMAMRVLITVLVPSLNLNLVVMAAVARALVIKVAILGLIDGYPPLVWVSIGVLPVDIPLVKGRAPVIMVRWFECRARALNSTACFIKVIIPRRAA